MNLTAYGMLGQILLVQGRLEQAPVKFEEIAQRRPDSVSVHTMLSIVLQLQNRPAEARDRHQEALSVDPRAAVAANHLALASIGR